MSVQRTMEVAVSLLTASTLQVASHAPVGMDTQETESPAQVN